MDQLQIFVKDLHISLYQKDTTRSKGSYLNIGLVVYKLL